MEDVIEGIYGYVDPEYYASGYVSSKSDAYTLEYVSSVHYNRIASILSGGWVQCSRICDETCQK